MTDHYAVLNLRSSATLSDIKKAFRQQAGIHHPDRNPAPEAAARFRAVQEAYDVLSDPVWRKAYDDNRQRDLGCLLQPPCLNATYTRDQHEHVCLFSRVACLLPS